jgi:hypothetical protein
MAYRERYRTFSDDYILGIRGRKSVPLSRDDISVAKYYDFDKDFLLELEAVLHALRDV